MSIKSVQHKKAIVVCLLTLMIIMSVNIRISVVNAENLVAKNSLILSLPIGKGDGQLAYSDDNEDLEMFGPASFFVLNNNVFILDATENQVEVFSLNNDYVKTINLPTDYTYRDIEAENENKLILLTYDDCVLTVDGDGNLLYKHIYDYGDERTIKSKLLHKTLDGIVKIMNLYDQSLTNISTNHITVENILESTSYEKGIEGVILIEGGTALKQSFSFEENSIDIIFEHQAGLTYPMRVLNDEELFFYEEEIILGENIYVESKISKYSGETRISSALIEETDKYEIMPNKLVYVTNTGEVYQMVCNEFSVEIFKLNFSSNEQTRIDFEANSKADILAEIMSNKRSQIAESALMHAGIMYDWCWQFDYEKNLSPTNNQITPPQHLNEERENGITTGIPYKWGGFDSMTIFLEKLDQGYTAGDVNTSAVTSDTAGVDCSGYVSRAYGFSYKLGTYTILNYFENISASEILPGEIFNDAGSHVVFFGGYNRNNGQIIGVQTLEATMDGSIDGTKAWERSLHELQHFLPMRLKSDYYSNFE